MPTPGPISGLITPPTGERSAAIGEPQREAPRLRIETPRLSGTLNLRGAAIDDLILKDNRETVRPDSPQVRLLAPRYAPAGYFAQWGWTAADGRTPVPGLETEWSASGGPLAPGRPDRSPGRACAGPPWGWTNPAPGRVGPPARPDRPGPASPRR